MEYLLLVVGIIIIIAGAQIFIDGIESTAINFKIPKMLIILTVVAFGTSAPELSISFNSVMSGNPEIVFSNVIGSTVVNSLLIIGVASIISPIKVKDNTIKKELPLHLLIIVVFSLLFLDSSFGFKTNALSRSDAIILLLCFMLFVRYLIYLVKKRNTILDFIKKEKPKFDLKKSVFYSLVGFALIIFGSNLAVDSAKNVALSLNWSNKVTTMIFIVIGTSIPELVMSIVSSRKKQYDFIIGNIVGTNIFNICIVLGLPILIFGKVETNAFSIVDIITIIISGIILLFSAKNDKVISKKEGIAMVLIFVLYYTYSFLA